MVQIIAKSGNLNFRSLNGSGRKMEITIIKIHTWLSGITNLSYFVFCMSHLGTNNSQDIPTVRDSTEDLFSRIQQCNENKYVHHRL